jgi:hypothetical protein
MTTYAKVNAERLVEYVISSLSTQPGLEKIDFVVGVPPARGYRLNIDTRQWVDTRTDEQKYNQRTEDVRNKRNQLLQQSDWTQLSDISAETKALWEPYRQALRDITEQPGYPFSIVWPTPPQ